MVACFSDSRLQDRLARAGIDPGVLADSHASLFSRTQLQISAEMAAQIRELIAAIESVIALPAYQERVLARAPAIARLPVAWRGVFFGYDFHLTESGPKLIEINTNAGGALLNACLLAAHGDEDQVSALELEFVNMFRAEWSLQHGERPLQHVAIVDEDPMAQYLAPEFLLFKELFEQHGMDVVICDPAELKRVGNQLQFAGKPVDLVYKRLTDFALDAAVNTDLRAVFEAGGVVLTPHPRAHALYADKRNLMLLSDAQALTEMGVPTATQAILLAGVPQTVAVSLSQAETFWQERKHWFFKPAAGYGSKATYRGDKLTKRVFAEILNGGYIAQRIVPPSEHRVSLPEGEVVLKADVRSYVYHGQLQLLAARLYQGQTTNFRTPGGGFAPVFIQENAPC